MPTPSEEFLDKLAAEVLENPSKEFLECVPENVLLTLQNARSRKTREMTKEEQEGFKQDWLNDRIPKKPLKRIRFPGDLLNT